LHHITVLALVTGLIPLLREMVMQKLTLLLLGLGALAACDDPGPLERAGEEVDEAVEDIGEGGETLGNRLDDAVDEVREGTEDAAEELENR
jgi:hypothetical protein